ncbi:MAG: hypothetical protein LBO71_01930 [Prevotellaceae bacterium]|jgi:O-antigen ligase|nr:hypothetical protein [Prevotellaceae bacterium]
MYDILFPLSVAIFGISFTLFTLFFSFIFNKREELRNISDVIKEGKGTLETRKKEKFAVRHIHKLKSLNKHIIILLSFSFFISVGIFLCRKSTNHIVEKICIILAIGLILYLVILFCLIMLYYLKSTKID